MKPLGTFTVAEPAGKAQSTSMAMDVTGKVMLLVNNYYCTCRGGWVTRMEAFA